MTSDWVRVGARYCIPEELIKYFYIDTSKNKLITKLRDGEEISLEYQGENATDDCLYNYVCLLDRFGIDYPKWLTPQTVRRVKGFNIDDEEDE